MTQTPPPTAIETVSALKPCPWHGDATELNVEDNGVGCFWVVCAKTGCGCEGPYAHSEAEAWEKWNARHSLDVEPAAFTTQRMLDAMREPDTICGSMWPKAAGDVTIPLYLASRTRNTETVVKDEPVAWPKPGWAVVPQAILDRWIDGYPFNDDSEEDRALFDQYRASMRPAEIATPEGSGK